MPAKKSSSKKEAPKGVIPPQKFKRKRTTTIPKASRGGGKIRQTQHHKFTEKARQTYLDFVGKSGRKMHAAEAAGVSYKTVQNYLAIHPEFQEEVDKSIETYRDVLLSEVHRRGVDGWVEKPILNKDGEVVGEHIKFSDKLLEISLRRVDPISRESTTKLEHSGGATIASVPFNVEKLEKLSREGRGHLRAVMQELAAMDAPKEPDAE